MNEVQVFLLIQNVTHLQTVVLHKYKIEKKTGKVYEGEKSDKNSKNDKKSR